MKTIKVKKLDFLVFSIFYQVIAFSAILSLVNAITLASESTGKIIAGITIIFAICFLYVFFKINQMVELK